MIFAFDRDAFLHDDLFRATLEELMIGMLARGGWWTKDLEVAESKGED